MANVRLTDLPSHTHVRAINTIGEMGSELIFPVSMGGSGAINSRATMSDIVKMVSKELGYVKNPLAKCGHCGQWGAVYCECQKCGAPIDPAQ